MQRIDILQLRGHRENCNRTRKNEIKRIDHRALLQMKDFQIIFVWRMHQILYSIEIELLHELQIIKTSSLRRLIRHDIEGCNIQMSCGHQSVKKLPCKPDIRARFHSLKKNTTMPIICLVMDDVIDGVVIAIPIAMTTYSSAINPRYEFLKLVYVTIIFDF